MSSHCCHRRQRQSKNAIRADVQNSADVAVGDNLQTAKTGNIHGNFNQIKDLRVGDDPRDIQYQTVLQWDEEKRLREFNLAGRVLSDIDLSGADLSGTNFTGAHMHKTNLCGANLTNSDFTDADLSHVDLRRANLWQAKLEGAQLQLVLYDKETKWPEGFDYQHCGALGPRAV